MLDRRFERRKADGMAQHRDPKVNVDTVLLTLKDDILHVATVPREHDPYLGEQALVGAIMDADVDETLEEVVVRSLKAKAGLSDLYFEQLYTFSGRNRKNGLKRDVRWPSISVAYIALVPYQFLTGSLQKAKGMELHPVDNLPSLPFDHNDIVATAVGRLRGKGAWSVLPAYLLDVEFTLPELHDVYSKVVGDGSYANFRRKVMDNDMVVSLGKKQKNTRYRPIEYFTLKSGVSTLDFKF
jgi:8-oxo-dGTP diphosphatase